jgi:hypothetical protein
MQADMSGFAAGIYLISVQGTNAHVLISKQ